jgi:multiple sugar transport system permease protein
MVNSGLAKLGINGINWLGDPLYAMPVLILLSIWQQLGFNMVVFLAGLQTIPTQQYEAAQLDGANGWQQFWYVTLPGLKPTLIFAAITTSIFTLKSFEPVYVITGGGPLNSTNLLVYYIYDRAFGKFEFGQAAAAAIVLLMVTAIIVYLQLKTWQNNAN